MEIVAWNSFYNAMHAAQDRRPFSMATLRRIFRFVRGHRTRLIGFIALSVVSAVLAVATPLLAGQVVNALFAGTAFEMVLRLAIIIAVIAIAEAAVGIVNRLMSARIGEGLILDLRQAVYDHVQKMPIAFFTRTRTGALVSRLNNDVIGAQRAFSETLSGVIGNVVRRRADLDRDAQPVLADHRVRADPVADLRHPGPSDGDPAGQARAGGRQPQLGDEHDDDRAVLGPGRDAGQAVRAAGAGVGRVRPARVAGARHRRPDGDGAGRLRHRADPGLRAGTGADVRAGWVLRAVRDAGGRSRRGVGAAVDPAVRPADRAGQRPGRSDECPGQLRPGVRGAGSDAVDHGEGGAGRAGAGWPGVGRTGRDRLRLSVCRQGVAGLPGGGRGAGSAGRRPGAARGVVPGRGGADGGTGRHVRCGQVDHRAVDHPAVRRRRWRGPARRGRRP